MKNALPHPNRLARYPYQIRTSLATIRRVMPQLAGPARVETITPGVLTPVLTKRALWVRGVCAQPWRKLQTNALVGIRGGPI